MKEREKGKENEKKENRQEYVKNGKMQCHSGT